VSVKAWEETGVLCDALAHVHAVLAGVWLRASETDISAEVQEVIAH